MPSRKSDQRRNEPTAARSALTEDDTDSQHPLTESEAVDSTLTSAQPHNQPSKKSSSPLQDKRDKEKESKGKDKDHDKSNVDKDGKDVTTIEDLALPKSIITRLAKGVLPPNTQIQANAILALTKSTTVFINYLATHANEHTVNANKKTIMPADVFKALEDTEFDFMKDRLEAEFTKFNAVQTEKRTSYRKKVRAAKGEEGPGDTTSMANEDADMTGVNGDNTIAEDAAASSSMISNPADGGPRAKKARVDPNASAVITDAETEEEDNEADEEDEEEEEDEGEGDTEEANGEEEEDDGEDDDSGAEHGDGLEERRRGEEVDEALGGDESD